MLSLVLPTYNEAKNIPALVPKLSEVLRGIEHEIIVVDDDSPDRTWEVVEFLMQDFSNLRVLRRVGRRGLSSAVTEGFAMAKGSVFAVMDADGQHDLEILPRLYISVEKSRGMAIGSRYVEGGDTGEWERGRESLSRLATWLSHQLSSVQVHDPMSGFFAIDAGLYRSIEKKLKPTGFKILLEVLAFVPKATTVEEVPFSFGKRLSGESKLTAKVQWEFMKQLLSLMIRR